MACFHWPTNTHAKNIGHSFFELPWPANKKISKLLLAKFLISFNKDIITTATLDSFNRTQYFHHIHNYNILHICDIWQ